MLTLDKDFQQTLILKKYRVKLQVNYKDINTSLGDFCLPTKKNIAKLKSHPTHVAVALNIKKSVYFLECIVFNCLTYCCLNCINCCLMFFAGMPSIFFRFAKAGMGLFCLTELAGITILLSSLSHYRNLNN